MTPTIQSQYTYLDMDKRKYFFVFKDTNKCNPVVTLSTVYKEKEEITQNCVTKEIKTEIKTDYYKSMTTNTPSGQIVGKTKKERNIQRNTQP